MNGIDPLGSSNEVVKNAPTLAIKSVGTEFDNLWSVVAKFSSPSFLVASNNLTDALTKINKLSKTARIPSTMNRAAIATWSPVHMSSSTHYLHKIV